MITFSIPNYGECRISFAEAKLVVTECRENRKLLAAKFMRDQYRITLDKALALCEVVAIQAQQRHH